MTLTQRYFVLFGPRASGKTAYLGALYGTIGDASDGGPAYHVAASEHADEPTHAYLGPISRSLKAGARPDATVFERLEKMTFVFTCGDLTREVVLPDVGGELTRHAVDAADRERLANELKEKILAEYADYRGFLIFVPADPVDASRASEYKWEVDAFLSFLRQRSPDGGTIARPFAVLVTKWDLVEPGPLAVDAEKLVEAYLEESHPELASGLRVLCRNLGVFPVSATGPTVGGFPPRPLRPMNLAAPVAWLVETSERVMLERAIAYIKRNRAGLFRRDPVDDQGRSCLRVARGRLTDFLEDVPHGPSPSRPELRTRSCGVCPYPKCGVERPSSSRRSSQ